MEKNTKSLNINYLFLFLFFLFSVASANCPDTLEYLKKKHELDQLLLKNKLDFFKKNKKLCSELSSKLCQNVLQSFKQEQKAIKARYTQTPLFLECLKDPTVGEKHSSEIFKRIGLYTYPKLEKCSETHIVKMFCWRSRKELDQCFYKNSKGLTEIWAKCKESELKDFDKTCLDKIQIDFSPYSNYCQISNEQWDKYKHCASNDLLNYRLNFCPRGCEQVPKDNVCLMKKKYLPTYLGCRGFENLKQFHLHCSHRCPKGTFWDKSELFCIKKRKK